MTAHDKQQTPSAISTSLWDQLCVLSGYYITRPPTPDHEFVQVCNGDLRKMVDLMSRAQPAPAEHVVGRLDSLASAFQGGFTNGKAVWDETPEHHKDMFRDGVRSLLSRVGTTSPSSQMVEGAISRIKALAISPCQGDEGKYLTQIVRICDDFQIATDDSRIAKADLHPSAVLGSEAREHRAPATSQGETP